MTDLIERAKAALELYDSHPELAEQCLPFMPDLARAFIREREAAERLARAVEVESDKAGMDHAVLSALAALRKATKETDDV